jgi:hypothetical protein
MTQKTITLTDAEATIVHRALQNYMSTISTVEDEINEINISSEYKSSFHTVAKNQKNLLKSVSISLMVFDLNSKHLYP